MPGGKFLVELIKPSHYDDDGYVIQWVRGWIPSNSLSSVFGLMLDLQARRVLGDDVDIEVNAYDETNTVVPIERIIRRFRGNGLQGLVCLVGVQTNQFPRALDIARPLRAAGIQVVIGGFHVSGCLAMLAEPPPDLAEARALGITLFAGEAEGRLEALVCAAHEQRLEPMYNHLEDLPHLDGQPVPFLPARLARRYAGTLGSLTLGEVAPSAAASAPSSTCRDANRATAMRTTWSRSSAPTLHRACTSSSSPTTTSLAIGTGRRSSIAWPSCTRCTASACT
jgi:hypothetical protein